MSVYPRLHTAYDGLVAARTGVVSASEFGIAGDGVTDDAAGLQAAINFAIANDSELYIPAGNYKTTRGLVWNDTHPRIRGAGMGKTFLRPQSTAYSTLQAGTGAEGLPGGSFIHGLGVIGPQANPTQTSKAAFQLNAVHHCELKHLSVYDHDIAYDCIGNCYGSYGIGLYARFGHCNVGLNLRGFNGGVFGSGSDLPFYNCWLSGGVAGVHISGAGGGYHFFGGQISSGMDSPSTSIAPVIMGKDYELGVTGVSDADFNGVDFEGWAKGYCFDMFDTCQLVVRSCNIQGTATGGNMAAGVWKHRDFKGSKLAFEHNRLGGSFTDAILRSYASVGSLTDEATIIEDGWDFRQVFANSVQIFDPCIEKLALAGGLSHARFRAGGYAVQMLGKMLLRYNDSVYQKSVDYGQNWSAV